VSFDANDGLGSPKPSQQGLKDLGGSRAVHCRDASWRASLKLVPEDGGLLTVLQDEWHRIKMQNRMKHYSAAGYEPPMLRPSQRTG
jgi:hypothetical protein